MAINMQNLTALAEKHFGCRDLNKIFHVKENASKAEGKSVKFVHIFFSQLVCFRLFSVQQSYKLLSRLVHPDRTRNSESTEKFQVLTQIYSVLMCQEKLKMFEIEKYVLILSDEEYTKSKMHYAGNQFSIPP